MASVGLIEVYFSSSAFYIQSQLIWFSFLLFASSLALAVVSTMDSLIFVGPLLVLYTLLLLLLLLFEVLFKSRTHLANCQMLTLFSLLLLPILLYFIVHLLLKLTVTALVASGFWMSGFSLLETIFYAPKGSITLSGNFSRDEFTLLVDTVIAVTCFCILCVERQRIVERIASSRVAEWKNRQWK